MTNTLIIYEFYVRRFNDIRRKKEGQDAQFQSEPKHV